MFGGTLKLGITKQRWVAQPAAFDFMVQHWRSRNNADSLSCQYSDQAI